MLSVKDLYVRLGHSASEYFSELIMAASITLVALLITIAYCGLVWNLETVYSLSFIMLFVGILYPYIFIYLLLSGNLLSSFARGPEGRRKLVNVLYLFPLWVICLRCAPTLIKGAWRLPYMEKLAGDVRTKFASEESFSMYNLTGNKRIRLLLASNAYTPQNILEKLEDDKRVSQALALNPALSTDALALLAKDPRANVRKAVALNQSASCDILSLLSKDSDVEVRNIAGLAYGERSKQAKEPVYAFSSKVSVWEIKVSSELCR